MRRQKQSNPLVRCRALRAKIKAQKALEDERATGALSGAHQTLLIF